MIKAVICDFGDTLINFYKVDVFKAFSKAANETYAYLSNDLGLKLPPLGRYQRNQQWSIRWAYFKSKITGREFNSLDILRISTKKLGIDIPEDKFDELAWRWYKPLADEARIDPYTVPMLEELQRRELKLAIVSNTFVPPSVLDRHLEKENLMRFFPLRVYSCEIGVRKPRPEIFQAVLQKLDIQPQDALFIGDSPSADIKGSRRAGMFAALKVIAHKRFKPDNRTFIAHTLDEIPRIVDRINHQFFNHTPNEQSDA